MEEQKGWRVRFRVFVFARGHERRGDVMGVRGGMPDCSEQKKTAPWWMRQRRRETIALVEAFQWPAQRRREVADLYTGERDGCWVELSGYGL